MKKLFCIPYAGGSAMIFDLWKTDLKNICEIIPQNFQGGGNHAPAYQNLSQLILKDSNDLLIYVILMIEIILCQLRQ